MGVPAMSFLSTLHTFKIVPLFSFSCLWFFYYLHQLATLSLILRELWKFSSGHPMLSSASDLRRGPLCYRHGVDQRSFRLPPFHPQLLTCARHAAPSFSACSTHTTDASISQEQQTHTSSFRSQTVA